MINRERLVDEFIKLASIESPSRHEGEIAGYLKKTASELGADLFEDSAAKETGSESGNILCRLEGSRPEAPAIFLNAHMDTVAPGRNIRPVVRDGTVYSGGDTILGSDDKSGIAIIIEVVRTLKDRRLPHGNLELLFTVCEEVGILGAKNFDTSLLDAKFGYSLDSTDVGTLIYAAPAANYIKFTIGGTESHAGLSPEKGLSAIKLAGEALSKMQLGRIDEETTANIGVIKGGRATNIVPGLVEMEGEARSHHMGKLHRQTEEMINCLQKTIDDANNEAADGQKATLDVEVRLDYPLMCLDESCRAVSLAKRAAGNLDMDLTLVVGGGGSDANIFNERGINVAIMPTGMDKVHTNGEQIKIDDMILSAELLMETIVENGKAH